MTFTEVNYFYRMPHHFEWICDNAANSTMWLVGNSQMAKFSGALGYYQIMYKRGGKIDELMAEAEWIILTKKATHVIVDGIQNSVMDIRSGSLNLEKDVFSRLKVLNKQAKVVLAEVLYCPEHLEYLSTLQWINRQVKRMNREASGMESPQPWKVLNTIFRNKNRKKADTVTIFPGSYAEDGYHINVTKILHYEAELASFMAAMVEDTQQ